MPAVKGGEKMKGGQGKSFSIKTAEIVVTIKFYQATKNQKRKE